MNSVRTFIAVLLVCAAWPALPASAQPLGSFRWQLQPYCNIITVTVTQQGGQYTLDGTDDQCGGAVQASVRGMAFQNPSGSIGLGLTIVTAPGGAPVHVDATISITTLSGVWHDSAGNNGTFIRTLGAGTGGGLRPVPSGGIAPGSITSVQIGSGAVGSTQLSTNSVAGVNVVNGSLTQADLADGPRMTFASGNQTVPLTPTDAIVRTVNLTIPATGSVMVNASGYFDFSSAGLDTGRCSITTGALLDFTHLIIADDAGITAATPFVPFAGTRGFSVSAGTFTVNLVCDAFSGTLDVQDTSITAMFVAS